MAIARVEEDEKAAFDELRDLIAARYPHARFDVVEGYDPPGRYLEVHVEAEDADDTFEGILDAVMDRLLVLQDRNGLDVYVMPVIETVQADP